MKSIIFALCILLAAGCIAGPEPVRNDSTDVNDTVIDQTVNDTFTEDITSFEECVAAGYPVMESYPRQCRIANGTTFVSLLDVFDISMNYSCFSDGDCLLVNRELGFSCCWAGACDAINYSEAKWIAANKSWYDSSRSQYCPEECGPAPGCAVRDLNANYSAKCLAFRCEKVPLEGENVSAIGFDFNETGNERIEGIVFADGSYMLVLDDIVLPAFDATCGAFSIRDTKNLSTIDNLLICEGGSKYWISPEGDEYRILLVEAAAGYTKEVKWAEVIIFG